MQQHFPSFRARKVWRCAVAVTAAAVVLSSMSLASPALTPAAADASTGSGGEFVPVQGRILDTRAASSVGGYTTPMPVNTWRSVQVTGQAGIPTSGVAAVAVNFTALNDTTAGHLNADKDEATPNTTGTFLFWNGNGASTNSGVVAVGTDGNIQVKATSATDLVIDVQGYYTSGNPAAGGYVPVSESRLVDTRNGTGLPATPLAQGSTTTVQVGGLAGVPSDASAVMLNFLVVNQTNSGSAIPYPADQPKPMQKLAFDPSDSDSTTSAVGLSATSPSGAIKINLEMNGSGGTLDLVIDVLGYFTASQSDGIFTPAAARAYDSRNAGNTALAGGASRTIQVAGVAGVPVTDLEAVAINVEIFDTAGTNGGWTHVWPDDQSEPNPSMAVQYGAGQSDSNLMTVALGADGGIEIHNMGSDTVDFAIDVEGWYAAAPAAPDAPFVTSYNYPEAVATTAAGLPLDLNFSQDAPDEIAASYSYSLDGAPFVTTTANTASLIAPTVNGTHEVDVYLTNPSGQTSDTTQYIFYIGSLPSVTGSTDISGGIDDPNLPAPTVDPAKQAELADPSIQNSIAYGTAQDAAKKLTYTTVAITGQRQQKDEWCGPGAVRAALTGFGVSVKQSTLASEMHTSDTTGTSIDYIPTGLVDHEGRNNYLEIQAQSATDFWTHIVTDIAKPYRAPLIPLVQGGDLPIWKAHHYSGHHFVTIYAYGNDKIHIKYFDPLATDPMYGKHSLDFRTMYYAMIANGNHFAF